MAPKTASTAPKKSSKTKEAVAPAPVEPTPPPPPPPPPPEAMDVDTKTPEESIADEEMIGTIEPDKLVEIAKQIHKLQRTMNKTQRGVNTILQHLEGVDPKAKKQRRPKKEPSGFAKPSLLSDELCDFLELPHGSKLARTEVTKKLTVYIKEKDLQNPQNRRQILLDDKLKKLLSVPEGTVVTFFNIQKFLSHYKQDTAPAAPVVTEATETTTAVA